MFISNSHSRKSKESEQRFELEKEKHNKQLEQEFNLEKQQQEHEKTIHSSLIKILFEVQKLHIALSGKCVDQNCIKDALKSFMPCFSKYQSIISDNQIFLSSKVTNHLYTFYNILGEVIIELKDINEIGKYHIALVCVYEKSQELAQEVNNIQELFIQNREYWKEKVEFNKEELDKFKSCCGNSPPQKLIQEYREAMNQLNQLPELDIGKINLQVDIKQNCA